MNSYKERIIYRNIVFKTKGVVVMNRTVLDRIALVLVIIGAINWLLIGFRDYNLVAEVISLFGLGSSFSIIYYIGGLSGLYTISLLFREAEPAKEQG